MKLFFMEQRLFGSNVDIMKKLIVTFIVTIFAFTAGCAKFPELGNGYFFDYDPRGDFSILKRLRQGDAPTYFIDGHILAYAVDSTFIVVEQRPRDRFPECTGAIPGNTLDDCEKAFKKSTFRQYWILNKKGNPEFNEKMLRHENVYGPYTKAEYIRAREKLGVPKGLKLKSL